MVFCTTQPELPRAMIISFQVLLQLTQYCGFPAQCLAVDLSSASELSYLYEIITAKHFQTSPLLIETLSALSAIRLSLFKRDEVASPSIAKGYCCSPGQGVCRMSFFRKIITDEETLTYRLFRLFQGLYFPLSTWPSRPAEILIRICVISLKPLFSL